MLMYVCQRSLKETRRGRFGKKEGSGVCSVEAKKEERIAVKRGTSATDGKRGKEQEREREREIAGACFANS